ncbi:MAG: cytochrome c biogenesis protein ResB [Leptospiraceae bacterium]|nr:cytochrome c biogenesis protein ResB [Leptospiraceae bacterium]
MPPLVWKILKWSSDTRVFFFALIWLSFLVIAGTLAQADLGLYQAQQKYFSAWILWIWYIPLPGGSPVLTIVFVGLLVKLIFFTNWKPRFYGTIVVHFGALLLLFGSFLTAAFSSEGAMVIPEGGRTAFVRDYHAIELAITNRANPEFDETVTFAAGWLKYGEVIHHEQLPFDLEIIQYCANCRLERRSGPPPSSEWKGMARNFNLTEIPLHKDDSNNMAGLVFRIKTKANANNNQLDGIYAIFENMNIPQAFKLAGGDYLLEIRHELRQLPFEIELIDFVKEDHPGTQMARSYSSEVNLIDSDVHQRVLISMNHPLRHKGYTLYQSSFIQAGMGETTVLAVVENVGRLFPYISSLIMCIGLLLHLLIKMPVLFHNRSNAGGEQ